MFLNLIVNYEKVNQIEADESILLFKTIQSDLVPRVHDHIQDLGFEEELLVKKVIWDFENNLCNIETRLVGCFKTIEEVKEKALTSGWRKFKE